MISSPFRQSAAVEGREHTRVVRVVEPAKIVARDTGRRERELLCAAHGGATRPGGGRGEEPDVVRKARDAVVRVREVAKCEVCARHYSGIGHRRVDYPVLRRRCRQGWCDQKQERQEGHDRGEHGDRKRSLKSRG